MYQYFFQIKIENSYFVPLLRLLTRQWTHKAPLYSYGFLEPAGALHICVAVAVIGTVSLQKGCKLCHLRKFETSGRRREEEASTEKLWELKIHFE